MKFVIKNGRLCRVRRKYKQGERFFLNRDEAINTAANLIGNVVAMFSMPVTLKTAEGEYVTLPKDVAGLILREAILNKFNVNDRKLPDSFDHINSAVIDSLRGYPSGMMKDIKDRTVVSPTGVWNRLDDRLK